MIDAPAKSFKKRTSRRSILKGLGAAAIGISFLGKKRSAWAADEEPKLNFYNWDTYIGETTLADFQEASGIDGQYEPVRHQRRAVRQAARRQSRASTSSCRRTSSSPA